MLAISVGESSTIKENAGTFSTTELIAAGTGTKFRLVGCLGSGAVYYSCYQDKSFRCCLVLGVIVGSKETFSISSIPQ